MYAIKIFFWNPSNCECECKESSDFTEYLDYKNCNCKKRLVNKLVECNETIDEMKLTKITLAENENSYKCNSCILYIVLFSIFFTINVGIGAYFVYYKYMNRNKNNVSRYDYIYIKQQFAKLIKWGKSNKLTLKIELIIFTTILSVSKILMPSC